MKPGAVLLRNRQTDEVVQALTAGQLDDFLSQVDDEQEPIFAELTAAEAADHEAAHGNVPAPEPSLEDLDASQFRDKAAGLQARVDVVTGERDEARAALQRVELELDQTRVGASGADDRLADVERKLVETETALETAVAEKAELEQLVDHREAELKAARDRVGELEAAAAAAKPGKGAKSA